MWVNLFLPTIDHSIPPAADQLNTKHPNYCVDIGCLSSNISTYIHCLGS
jgi:hypothetical protein